MIPHTPSQTVGPFFHFSLTERPANILVNDRTQGQPIILTGQVLDGDGQAVPDALIEIWQADANGHFNHPADPGHGQADQNFPGFGRSDTVTDGRYYFKTVRPGPVPWDDQIVQAPHIDIRVFARGLLIHAYTRVYFPEDAAALQTDPILNRVPGDRRPTLISQRQVSADLPTYRHDIRLQGERETVFFDL